MNVRCRSPGSAADAVATRQDEAQRRSGSRDRSCRIGSRTPLKLTCEARNERGRPVDQGPGPPIRLREPYSADSIDSSNRKTAARSSLETDVWASAVSASDAVRPSATMFRMSAIRPITADRTAAKRFPRSPVGKALRSFGQLALGGPPRGSLPLPDHDRPTCDDGRRGRRSSIRPPARNRPRPRPARRR